MIDDQYSLVIDNDKIYHSKTTNDNIDSEFYPYDR